MCSLRFRCSNYNYNLRSKINVPFLFGFCRKLALTKTQQSTDKASKHNRLTILSHALIFLTHASSGVVSKNSYNFLSIFITLPHNFHQLPLFAYNSVTNRVRRHPQSTHPPPPGLGGHEKLYDHVSQRFPNDTNMLKMTYHASADLFANYRHSGDTSVLRLWGLRRHWYHPLFRKPGTRKREINTPARPEEYTTILHLLLRFRLWIGHQNRYVLRLWIQTKMTKTRRCQRFPAHYDWYYTLVSLLFPSSPSHISAFVLMIRCPHNSTNILCFTHCLASIPHPCCWYLNRPTSLPPHLL